MPAIRIAVIHHPDNLEFSFAEPQGEPYVTSVVKKWHSWIGWGGELKTMSFTVVNGVISSVLTANGIKSMTSGRKDLGVPFMTLDQMDPRFESLAYRLIRAYLEDVFHIEGQPFEPVEFEHYVPVQGHRVMEYQRID